ncbi:MAG: aminopeptidase P family protein [Ruminococcaceae bacterium]|nr:aminopeptidase P family protein [Oscillospiraceae bacterium]
MSHLSNIQKNLKTDALLVTSEVNLRYLTGFHYSDGCTVVTRDRAYLITDFRYKEAAEATVSDEFTVLCPQSIKNTLCELLSSDGAFTVAVEEATLSAQDLERLRALLPKTEFSFGGSALLDGARRIKDAGEIEKMKRAQAITDAAFEHILNFIDPSRTEVEIALELEFFMRSHGAESVAFQTITVSGSASSLPHGVPRPVKLERGFLTMDFGACVDGYCSDMTRTVVIGNADGEIKRLYNTVLAAQLAALDAAEKGERSGFMLDKIARDVIDDAGYRGAFGHSLGHGVGMYIHEAPRLAPRTPKDELLCPGNVVTFEPGIYLEGKYGCRIEDMAVITEDGIYNFTKSTKELIEIK